jgi:hypothetical protein
MFNKPFIAKKLQMKVILNLFRKNDIKYDNSNINYYTIKQLLNNELQLYNNGNPTIFNDYRLNRKQLFTDAQFTLYENVLSIFDNSETLMTVPLSNTIFTNIYNDNKLDAVYIKDRKFLSGGFKIKNYIVPILPMNVEFNTKCNQSLRGWIRTIYGSRHNINPVSDQTLYYFLTDVFRILLSDNVSIDIKNAYKDIVKIMFDRERADTKTKITEYDFMSMIYKS